MAESKVIEISFGNTLTEIERVTKSLAALKKEREDLAKAVEQGRVSEETASKSMILLNNGIKDQTKELTSLNRVVENGIKQRRQEEGSIAANRAELARLTAEYIKLGKPTKEQTDKIKLLSETLKKQEAAIGDNRRSVGGYREAIVSVISTLPGASTAFKSFGVATNAAAGPVGLVTTAIQFLIGALQKNETIIKLITSITDGFSSVLKVLTDRVLQLAGPLKSAFENPKQAIKDLVDLIKDNLINRFKALGVIVDGIAKRDIKQITNGILQFGSGVEDVTGKISNLGKDIANTFAEAQKGSFAIENLDDAERALNETLAESRKRQAALLVIAKDKTKSDKERLAAANEIIKLEDEASKKQIAAIQNELKIRQAALAGRKATDEEANKISELRVQLTERETEALAVQGKQQIRINQILDKGESALTKTTENELEKREAARLKYYETISKLEEEFGLNEREKIENNFDKKLELIQGQSEREIELRKQIELEKQNALDAYDQQLLSAKIERENQAALDQLETELIIARTNGETVFQEQLAIEEEKQRQIIESEKFGLEEKERLIAESNERISGLYQKQGEYEIATERAIQDAKIGIVQNSASILTSIAELFGQEGEAQGKFAKALGLFQIGIDTAVAIVQAIRNANSPTPDNVLSGGLAAIAKAAAITAQILAGAASARKLLTSNKEPKAPKSKFAEGGGINIEGASHAEGGAEVAIDGRPVAEVEGGERLFVLKKSASAQIEKLSAFNQLFGGRSWTGKPVRHAAEGGILDGGFAARSISDSVNNQLETVELMKAAMRSAPSPVVRVTEINKVQSSVSQTVEVSSL